MVRLLLAAALAIGLSTLPLATVSACSCAMPGTPEETVRASDLAFVGTVTESRQGPPDVMGPGQRIAYSFEIERASAAAPPVVEVLSLDDPGGAACGMAFGIGERWFVAAYEEPDGSLGTGLCSGNLMVEGMADGDLARIMGALSFAPGDDAEPAPVDGSESTALSISPALIAGAFGAILVVLTVLAFRSGEPPRPR